MSELRYGFVGGGFITSFHLQALREVRGAEVAGFFSKEPVDHLIAYSKENGLGTPKGYSSIAAMIPEVDVVAICAPNFARVEIVEEIVDTIKGGANLKGLIIEKPFARNMPEARRIMGLLEEIDVPDAYFENQVHMKAVQAQRSQLKPVIEAMGPVTLFRASEEHAGPHSPWFWDPTRQGGGVMSDMGCHCLAVAGYGLTPPGKPIHFLEPVSVMADLSLLKWGQPHWRKELLKEKGVDYSKVAAEDFATGIVTYRNPDSGQLVKGQFTVSWMYDKQGLRLLMDGLGAGYGFEMNSLRSPLEIFIGDVAVAEIADSETALEKATASSGLLAVQPNEPDLYGYTDENIDAIAAFTQGRPPLLDSKYGMEIVRLNMAAYMSAERGCSIDLTDETINKELETYIPLIQQGRGNEIL